MKKPARINWMISLRDENGKRMVIPCGTCEIEELPRHEGGCTIFWSQNGCERTAELTPREFGYYLSDRHIVRLDNE